MDGVDEKRNNLAIFMLGQQPDILIGIDTGTHTGVAVWDSRARKFLKLLTVPIHKAWAFVIDQHARYGDRLFVIFEDARQRSWYGSDSGRVAAKLQGAGSVKRDAAIWEDFLTDYGIAFRAVPPVRGATKLDGDYFARLTGWTEKTSNHARDAAMLVFGR